MTDRDLERFFAGDMTPEQELRFLDGRPELARRIELSALMDGEASPQEAERVYSALLESADLREELDEVIRADAWMEENVRAESEDASRATSIPIAAAKTRAWLWIPIAVAASIPLATVGVRHVQLVRAQTAVDAWVSSVHPHEFGPRWTYGAAARAGEPADGFPAASVALLRDRGRYHAAATAFARHGDAAAARETLLLADRTPDTESDLAAAALALDEPKEAARHARAALAMISEHSAARWNLALAEWSLGRAEAAFAALDETVARDAAPWPARAKELRDTWKRPLVTMLLPHLGRAKFRGAGIGGRIRIDVRVGDAPHSALRIYLRGVGLVGQCPSAACVRRGDLIRVDVPIESRGLYQVLWMTSGSPITAPQGDVEADVAALTDGEERLEEIEVH